MAVVRESANDLKQKAKNVKYFPNFSCPTKERGGFIRVKIGALPQYLSKHTAHLA